MKFQTILLSTISLLSAHAASGRTMPLPPQEITRSVLVHANFIQLPLIRGRNSDEVNFTIMEGSKVVRFSHLQLATKDQKPDWIYSYDVREFHGQDVTLHYKSSDTNILQNLQLSHQQIIDPHAYDGPNRPLFHFSPRVGWMNDINGSYYQDGLYHIFYQANPVRNGSSCGYDMHWGHSVSKDLVHWEEWPIGLFPNAAGQCYSGTVFFITNAISGITDHLKLPTPALMFTGTTPFSQHLATTADGGRSWQRYAGNPVLPNIGPGNRDPNVFWHEPSKHFVMALYVGGKGYVILRSGNLTNWKQTCVLPNWEECPVLIPIKSPTTGGELWLLYGRYNTPKNDENQFHAASAYQLGNFDGKVFTPVTKVRRAHLGPNFYAALTFVNEPQGRAIMMGWANGTHFPKEPFNQCASLPLQLSLTVINGVDTLCFEPVLELNILHGQPLLQLTDVSITEANAKLQTLDKNAPIDVLIKLHPVEKEIVKISIRNLAFSYDPSSGNLILLKNGLKISETVIHPRVSLNIRFLIDHGLVDAFWNDGEATYSIVSLHTDNGPAFDIQGHEIIQNLSIFPMKNIWKN